MPKKGVAFAAPFFFCIHSLFRYRIKNIHPGVNVGKGSDDTLFALKSGKVKFESLGKDRKQVSIVEVEIAQ